MIELSHILVPIDFSEASEQALDSALGLAAKFHAKVTLVHAVFLPPSYYSAYAEGLAWPVNELEGEAKRELNAITAKAKERYSNVESTLIAGDPATHILEAAKEKGADLIVMGTHGRRGISRVFLGSVAEKIVRLSHIPVMTVCTEAERRAKEQALG